MKLTRNFLVLLSGVVFAGGLALAQEGYGDPNEGPPGDDDIRQTVARLAYVSGDVSFARGDDPDAWQAADPNVPMTLGDRVWTADGRLELQVHGGNVIRLAKSTDLTALNLTEDTQQFSVSAGVASFQIRRLGDDDVFEVDTPNAAITFERAGDYRVDVREDGNTRLQVRRGRAIVASGGGQVPLGAGDAMLIEGQEPPRYDMVAIGAPDGWDQWVASRDARYDNVRSYQYVSSDIAGVEDLDRNGNWRQIPEYGWSWTPTAVAVGWQPYRAGRWIWQDPWGWTWVSTEQWGWAPYHYGRWVTWQSSWYWVPVAPRATVVAYSPALVAFVGGGPGFSVSASVGGPDYVGWFPLAPREPLHPWWGRSAVAVPVTNVTNVTYVNRTYVTVVNQQTFVTSSVVTNNYVRDQAIVTRVERAPVVRGAVPIVPTTASLRVATRGAPAVRPPAAVAERAVVTRSAPPPAPPRFDQKVAVIRENKGRPVTMAEAANISTKDNRPAQPVRAVRPAAEESGRVTFVPKTEGSNAPKPEPVAANRGRPLATKQQPVATPRPVSNAARMQQQVPQRPATQSPEMEEKPAPAQRPPSAAPVQQRPQTVQEREQSEERPTPVQRPPSAAPVQQRPQTVQERAQIEERPTPVQRPPSAAPVQQRPQTVQEREQIEERPTPVQRPPSAAPVQQRPQTMQERPMAHPAPTVRPPDRHAASTEERPANAAPAQAQAPRPPARPTPHAPAPTRVQPDPGHPENGQTRAGAPVTPAAHSGRPAPTRTPKKSDERSDS